MAYKKTLKEKQEKIRELAKAKQKEFRDKISDASENLINQIRRDEINGMVALSEEIFNERFKPYMTGEKDLKENPAVLEEWKRLTGSLKKGVLILDGEGKVIGKTQGFYRESQPVLSTSLSRAYNEYENLKKAGRTGDAKRVLEESLSKAKNDMEKGIEINYKELDKIADEIEDYVMYDD
jgi:gas vesicle protein